MTALESLVKNRKLIYAAWFCQVILVAIVTLSWLIFKNWPAALSAFMGGGTWLLPSLYFTYRTARLLKPKTGKAFDPMQLLTSFYAGEIFKFLISMLLIVLSILILPVIILPFLSGYLVAVLAIFLLPLWIKIQHRQL